MIQSDDAGVPLHHHVPGLQGARISSHEIMSYKKKSCHFMISVDVVEVQEKSRDHVWPLFDSGTRQLLSQVKGWAERALLTPWQVWFGARRACRSGVSPPLRLHSVPLVAIFADKHKKHSRSPWSTLRLFSDRWKQMVWRLVSAKYIKQRWCFGCCMLLSLFLSSDRQYCEKGSLISTLNLAHPS